MKTSICAHISATPPRLSDDPFDNRSESSLCAHMHLMASFATMAAPGISVFALTLVVSPCAACPALVPVDRADQRRSGWCILPNQIILHPLIADVARMHVPVIADADTF